MTTASFNIKTTNLVGNTIFFMRQRNNTFVINSIFVCTRSSFYAFMFKSLLFWQCDPSRRTNFSNMKQSQHRRNICFIEFCFEVIINKVTQTSCIFSLYCHASIPKIFKLSHGLLIAELNKQKLVKISCSETIQFFAHNILRFYNCSFPIFTTYC